MEKTKAEEINNGNELENIRMSIGTHLEELRRRVVYSLIAIVFAL